MKILRSNNTYISSIGIYIPTDKLDNSQLASRFDCSSQWLYIRSGINVRAIANDKESEEYMGASALRDALKESSITINELDMLLTYNVSNLKKLPLLSSKILSFFPEVSDIPILDSSIACSGYVYGSFIASSLLSNQLHTIAIVCTDKMSAILDPNDRNTVLLFGDAAASTILTDKKDLAILEIEYSSVGALDMNNNSKISISNENYIVMDGIYVYKWVIQSIPSLIQEFLRRISKSMDDIDYIIPHQANKRIIEVLITKLSLKKTEVLINIEEIGNTSASSSIITLEHFLKNKRIKRNTYVLIVVFGAGMSYGIQLIKVL